MKHFLLFTLTAFSLLLICRLAESSTETGRSRWTLPSGTHAVITGGTKGIGHAIVDELASLGARVLFCARNPDDIKTCCEQWNEKGYDCTGVVVDVADASDREKFVEDIRKWLGGKPLDILVNNVGTNIRKPSIEYSEEDVQKVWNTNFNSMFGLTTKCYEFLRRTDVQRQGYSNVINIGSVAGVTCMKSGTPYASTKAAINQITGNWACEWVSTTLILSYIAFTG